MVATRAAVAKAAVMEAKVVAEITATRVVVKVASISASLPGD